MAGRSAGCFTSLVLLMALQLAFFTTNSGAARSHPFGLLQFLSGSAVTAMGERAFNEEPCCTCICPMIYPPKCICAGEWEGSCPSACTNCNCDSGGKNNMCRCEDGLVEADKCRVSDCFRRRRASSKKNSLPTSKENGAVEDVGY